MKRVTPEYLNAYRELHTRNLDEQYELRKKLWEEEHPEATYTEHERAMREIADELGV